MSAPRTTLYEFMPYGAPELIDAGRAHLRGALTLAMIGALALFGTLLVASRILARSAGNVLVIDVTPHTLVHVPDDVDRVRPTLQIKIALPRPARPLAVPLPVPDRVAPHLETLPAIVEGPPADARAGETGGAIQPVVGEAGGETLPGPSDWVYTEELPALVSTVVPGYPDFARDAGIEGTVVVRAMVGKDGHVIDVRIARSIAGLDEAAAEAVRRWRFTPALANQQPVVVWVSVPVLFRLH